MKKQKSQTTSMNIKEIALEYRWQELFLTEINTVFAKLNSYENELLPNELNTLKNYSMEAIEKYKGLTKNLVLPPHQPKLKSNLASTNSTKNRRILFVTGIFPGMGHGGGLRIYDMMEELSKRNYKVDLFTLKAPKEESPTTLKLKKILNKVIIAQPANYNQLGLYNEILKQSENYQAIYYVWPYIADMIFNRNQVCSNQIFEFIEVTSRRLWMDIVLMIKENNLNELAEKINDFWFHYNLEKKAVVNCNKLTCVTPKDAEFVNFLFDTQVAKIIPTGISNEAILKEVDQQSHSNVIPQSVGFLGNYFHYPNLDGVDWYLTNVHEHVLKKVPNYKFHVLGKGPLNQLKEKFKHYKKSIVWTGEIDNIVASLKQMEICAVPLINGAGIRGKINQYAIVGKPIVSTTIGACGTPYVHKKSVLIADEPIDFANHLTDLLQNNSDQKKLAKNALVVVEENFYWKNFIDDLESIL